MSKTGSNDFKYVNAKSAPATPQKNELIAKACNLVLSKETPIDSADLP